MNTIKTMKDFAETVKTVMEAYLGERANVTVMEITKNNGIKLTGVTISDKKFNIAPTIFMEDYFKEYNSGKSMNNICQEIIKTYEKNKISNNIDMHMIMDFSSIKNLICCKLINADKNKKLLEEIPHVIIEDLAIVFYILISNNELGTGTITVRNNMTEIWGVTAQKLYKLAMENTQRLFHGYVTSIVNVMEEIIESMDEENKDGLFDIIAGDINIPMFVVSNTAKLNGAIVMLYDNLMKKFSEKIGRSFYIIPSSVHETLFVPCFDDINTENLQDMVRVVNATQITPEEILSDNVYYYDADTETFGIAR